jgi:ribose transport system permease protein
MMKSEVETRQEPAAGVIQTAGKRILETQEISLVLIVLVAAGIVFAINPVFATLYNLQVIARSIAIFAILAVAETMVVITGGIELSAGSMVALGGVLLALMLRAGWGIPLSILMTLVASGIIGLWHGFAVAKIGVNPFIITLGTMSIARGAAVTITRGIPIRNLPESFFWVGRGDLFGVIPVPVVIALVVVLYGLFILNFTPMGRYLRAVGGNKEAARLAGVPVNGVLLFVYAQAPILFALTGIILVGRLGQGYPGVAVGYEFRAITAAVIGGTSLFGGVGSIMGAVLGACLMGVIDDALILIQADPYIQDIVMGGAVVIAVLIDVLRQNRRARA